MESNHYKKFGIMLTLSFVIMYGVMFLNVDAVSHIYLSPTRFYMTLLMVCPMAIVMLLMMPMMYPKKMLNRSIMTIATFVFFGALIGLRQQVFVDDEAYMKAMIPHHSSAILTSKNATLNDAEVKALSVKIIESQEQEIKQMKAILARLDQNQ